MNNKWKRRSLLAVCALLFIGITVGSFAAWLNAGNRNSTSDQFRLGTLEYINIEATGGVTIVNNTVRLVPVDQPINMQEPGQGRFLQIQVTVDSASVAYNIAARYTLTDRTFAPTSSLRIVTAADFAAFNALATDLELDAAEPANDAARAAALESARNLSTPIGTTQTSLTTNHGATTGAPVVHNFYLILDSNEESDMGAQFTLTFYLLGAS